VFDASEIGAASLQQVVAAADTEAAQADDCPGGDMMLRFFHILISIRFFEVK
jgi:hypothetical protein